MPPCGVWTIKAVPTASLDEVVAEFEADNPTKVDKIDNHNGTFDVVATFPHAQVTPIPISQII